jgi:hypothetical protein
MKVMRKEFSEGVQKVSRATGIDKNEIIFRMTVLLGKVGRKPADVCGICIEDGAIYIATGSASFRVSTRLEFIRRHQSNPVGYAVGNNETGHRLPASASYHQW